MEEKENLNLNHKGQVSVETENIFPIIRKWLYSDKDIFIRELVSNAADAIQKYERLIQLAEIPAVENESLKITVVLDRDKSELIFEDTGIGMDEEEIKKYINSIAFSGALDFIQQYEDKGENGAGIIGHFGLGFYSAFMVSEQVEIFTKSCKENSQTVHWRSEDGINFEMGIADESMSLKSHGTRIVLHIDDENRDEIGAAFVRDTLNKYCSFMKYPIYFVDVYAEAEEETRRLEKMAELGNKLTSANDEEKENIQKELDDLSNKTQERQEINYFPALWLKAPKDCTEEEYKDFYHKCFQDFNDPLFQIHLNLDYPFNLKGILYFPKQEERVETLDGRIKLYYNRVFVADNLKDLIPDFLCLLRGIIDCPDLPLNVSRSFLQNDTYLKKLSEHIVRKVADKLLDMFKKNKDNYQKVFEDIKLFVRYGCMTNEKFMDRVKDALIFKKLDGSYINLNELPDKVYYANDVQKQQLYVKRHEEAGNTVIIMDHEIDLPFMRQLSYRGEKHINFMRVDSDLPGDDQEIHNKESIRKFLQKMSGDKDLEVEIKSLGEDDLPAILLEDEQSREMYEFQKRFANSQFASMADNFKLKYKLLLNADNVLSKKLLKLCDDENNESTKSLAKTIYQMAKLSHGSMSANELEEFLKTISAELL